MLNANILFVISDAPVFMPATVSANAGPSTTWWSGTIGDIAVAPRTLLLRPLSPPALATASGDADLRGEASNVPRDLREYTFDRNMVQSMARARRPRQPT